MLVTEGRTDFFIEGLIGSAFTGDVGESGRLASQAFFAGGFEQGLGGSFGCGLYDFVTGAAGTPDGVGVGSGIHAIQGKAGFMVKSRLKGNMDCSRREKCAVYMSLEVGHMDADVIVTIVIMVAV